VKFSGCRATVFLFKMSRIITVGLAKSTHEKCLSYCYVCKVFLLNSAMLYTFHKINNMNSQKVNLRVGILVAIILLAAFSRIIPHMPNFSPLGAIGIFGAAHFSKKWQALFIPLSATWLSDLFINNVIYAKYYPTFTWFAQGFYLQYAAYILIAIAGFFIMKKVNPSRVLFGALASSAIFFIVSNFGCWPGSAYPQNFAGLMQCFAAGVPFVQGTILGDLFYCTILFGGFALIQKQVPFLRRVNA
jgi:hypothetical protein